MNILGCGYAHCKDRVNFRMWSSPYITRFTGSLHASCDDSCRIPPTRWFPKNATFPQIRRWISCRAMEFIAIKWSKRKLVRSAEYPTRLQLYKTPPVDTISLQEFEELALQRLKRECCSVSQLRCEHIYWVYHTSLWLFETTKKLLTFSVASPWWSGVWGHSKGGLLYLRLWYALYALIF